jgi:hypothetical protein
MAGLMMVIRILTNKHMKPNRKKIVTRREFNRHWRLMMLRNWWRAQQDARDVIGDFIVIMIILAIATLTYIMLTA